MDKIIKYFFDKKALTLIEILLVVIILGIVVMISTTMIIQSFSIVGSSSSRMSTKQLIALAEDRIEKHLHTAVKSSDNNFGKGKNKVQWSFKGYSNEGVEIEYEIEKKNNKLFLKVGNKPEEVILNNVNNFYIEEEDSNELFRLYFEVKDDTDLISREKIINARNY